MQNRDGDACCAAGEGDAPPRNPATEWDVHNRANRQYPPQRDGSAPLPMQKAWPTRDAADQYLAGFTRKTFADLDANDFLYQVDSEFGVRVRTPYQKAKERRRLAGRRI
jgi:hypothetical protein